jgi:hypothetical protein
MLAVEHERYLLVGVVGHQMANQIVDLLARHVSMLAGVVQTARQFRRCTTHALDGQMGNDSFAIDQDYHFGDNAT